MWNQTKYLLLQPSLAVVRSDADLEPRDVAMRIVDHAADLEPAHLADQCAVFDQRLGTALGDPATELEVGLRHLLGDEVRFGQGRKQVATRGVPHRDRQLEALGAARHDTRTRLGDDVDGAGPAAQRPHEGRPETTLRLVVEQDPRRVVVDQGGARDELLGVGQIVDVEVVAHEGTQLELLQPAASGVVIAHDTDRIGLGTTPAGARQVSTT